MSNIFITYGDERYVFARKRIAKQAKKTHIFSKIKVYTPADLPQHIKGSPLFQYKRGGGYWVWKPYIILDALSKAKEGDVVWYADAGCAINPSSDEWQTLLEKLKTHDAIYFKYRDDHDYGWTKYKNNSVKLIHWSKPFTSDFFRQYCMHDYDQLSSLWSGFIIIKKGRQSVILDEWMRLYLFHPQLATDPIGKEAENLPSTFNQHRHDQTIISYLVYKYHKEDNALILDETAESQQDKAAIVAQRYRAGLTHTFNDFKTWIYYLFH